jgi:hypothetical protein
MFSLKTAAKSLNVSLQFLKNSINKVVFGYIVLLYLITGPEHNGDALPENYKKLVVYAVCITLLKFFRICAFQDFTAAGEDSQMGERLSNLISTNKVA